MKYVIRTVNYLGNTWYCGLYNKRYFSVAKARKFDFQTATRLVNAWTYGGKFPDHEAVPVDEALKEELMREVLKA